MSAIVGLPTQPEERIASLDVLRAFALLGILVVNMWDFAYTPSFQPPFERWPAWWDQTAYVGVTALFVGKFNSLFSFLFGVGFFLQLQRLSSPASSGGIVYLRRLSVLFALGVLHAIFVWHGDVLHIYAVLGAVLLVLRKASNKVIWSAMLICLLLPPALSTYTVATTTPEEEARLLSESRAQIDESSRAFTQGSYWDATRSRVAYQRFSYRSVREVLGQYAIFLTTVLLGFWVARAGYLGRSVERRASLIRTMFWCLAIGIGCSAAMVVAAVLTQEPGLSPLGTIFMTAYSFGRPTLMLAYAIALVLLIDSRWFPRFFHWLTFVGRMPLTNYLMQSVVCTLLFYGYGFGAIDTINPAAAFVLCFAIWGVQIVISVLWFRYFQFGPMEWLWRALTYGAVRAPQRQTVAAPILH